MRSAQLVASLNFMDVLSSANGTSELEEFQTMGRRPFELWSTSQVLQVKYSLDSLWGPKCVPVTHSGKKLFTVQQLREEKSFPASILPFFASWNLKLRA